MKSKHKRFIILLGYIEAVAMHSVLFFIFIYAFFNGFKTSIHINAIGEANVEFVLLTILSVIMLFGIYFLLKEWKNKNLCKKV